MRTATRTGHRPPAEATPAARTARTATAVVASVFLLVGIAGFIPGLTTNVGDMEWAGPHEGGPRSELVGIFHVSVLHNLVHIGTGLIGLAAAVSARTGIGFLVIGGIVYGAVWIYGWAIDNQSDANFLPTDRADNWLHAGLTVGDRKSVV